MKLAEALDRVQELASEDVIFAVRPWTMNAATEIGILDSDYRVPQVYKERGLEYFLDASLAQEILSDVADRGFTKDQLRDLLLFYVENDAFPEWTKSSEGSE
jgi:hypothetical protein